MKEGQSRPPASLIRRQDYLPPTHRITDLQLAFDLDLTQTTVVAEFGFVSATEEPCDLMLAGDGLQFVAAWLDDAPLSPEAYRVTPMAFVLPKALRGRLKIKTQLDPTANTELMGLYASRGGLYTQCESEGFRRITYFLDRPDVLTCYTVTLRGKAEAFPVLLSNGNLVSESMADGIKTSVWHDPFPKPSYLFALVAADLACIEETITSRSGAPKRLQVYTKPDDLARAGHALESLKRSVFWDERRFGLELDLERFMIVAVPDFNSGAMENKGLNLFNTKYVLADPESATDKDYELVQAVIGHEYFHNWTGNRITCRDWFQLTLKEGLTVLRDQEFTADMLAEGLTEAQAASSRAVKRIEDVRTLRAHQFPEDAGPMAHPIRPAEYQEIRNFYTATVYEKGAEVIRMLQTLLGVDGFRSGMDLYFLRHDGQAATCEDFVSSILDANKRSELFAAFMRWYDTPGTPHLKVRDAWESASGRYTVTFTQTLDPRSPQQQPLPIPVAWGLLSQAGDPITLPGRVGSAPLGDGEVFLMDQASMTVELVLTGQKGAAAPIPSLMRNFSAPVVLDYPYTAQQLSRLAGHDSDPFNRWESCQRLIMGQLMPALASAEDRQSVMQTLAAVLTHPGLSDAFKALALSVPADNTVVEAWAAEGHAVDPVQIRARIEAVRLAMALAMEAEWQRLDAENDAVESGPYSPNALDVGRRSLRHLAQSMVTLVMPDAARATTLWSRYRSASHMTRRMACLSGIVSLEHVAPEVAAQSLGDFAQRYAHDPLSMDKWFSVQIATPRLHDQEGYTILARVQSLLSHPLYDLANPNRVRAVLGVYFMASLSGFHRADGQGYRLWADSLGALALRNSQLAARLARSLDRWKTFEPSRRGAMQQAIEALAATPNLPPDVAEVCGRFLE
jgi:aminopeptidase N